MELDTRAHVFPTEKELWLELGVHAYLIQVLPRIRYGIMDARSIFSGCFTHQVAGQWEYGTMDGIMYNLKHIHQYYTCSLQAGAT